MVERCDVNELRGPQLASIAETAIGRAMTGRRFCEARASPSGIAAAQSGIRVVTIAPGTFDTPLLAGLPARGL